MKARDAVMSVAIVVAGVLVAGFVMGALRSQVPLIAKAHSGFDS